MNLKHQLHYACLKLIEQRLLVIKNTITELQNALTSETKSSAGDKHETGRAMVQLEREKAGVQLAEIQKVKSVLSKIDTSSKSSKITIGSIVYTTQANYFIAISAGELEIENQKFYAISASTPIGQLLLGKTVGDEVAFREQRFEIIEVL